jgi:hypothetical protein
MVLRDGELSPPKQPHAGLLTRVYGFKVAFKRCEKADMAS